MSALFLPTPALLALFVLFIGVVIFVAIRAERKNRLVPPWKNEVIPEWSNISERDFDQLRHLLGRKKRRVLRQSHHADTLAMDETEHTQHADGNSEVVIVSKREDIVYVVCRRHWITGLGLIPATLLFIIGVVLTIVLSRVDTSAVTTVPIWRLGVAISLGAFGLGLWSWIEWRCVFYMVTNQAVHIIKQPPMWLALWPGYHLRLPLARVSMANKAETMLGNALNFVTIQIGTNMSGKEDRNFNDMRNTPEEAEFDVRVNELVAG